MSDNADWLTLDPTSATSNGGAASIMVSVDITGMSAGSYDATITISAPDATNTPETVPVSLVITITVDWDPWAYDNNPTDGVIDIFEVLAAIVDYFDEVIDISEVLDVIVLYFGGGD